MSKLPVGIQLYSVRDDMSKDMAGTIKAIGAMGYDLVEFAGVFGHTADEVKIMCEDAGVKPISTHVGMNEVAKDFHGIVKLYHDIGCKYFIIPWIDKNYLPGGENYQKFLDEIEELSAECAKYGMKLCYHNHDFEFEKVDGKNKLDILYADTTPEQLQSEIDTCWARVGGENPAEYVKKYTGRAPVVHLKDYYGSKSANMYGLIDSGDSDKKQEKTPENSPFEFRPIGYGVQDVASILKAAEEAGAEAVIVEQDKPSMGKTPLECAKMSIDYIRSL